MIKLENVYKIYQIGDDQFKALDNINLEIKSKEFVGILGSSGSGKSTLMHIIGLLDQPTSGEVYLNGKDVSKLTDTELSHVRNREVGFVFQSFNLINRFTVLENVLMPVHYLKDRIDFNPEKRALDLLERFGIAHRKDFMPNKISGGQQQRVAIARALMMNPKIILADEPTGNLDSKTGDDIINILKDLNKDFDVTVVVVTHELDIAKKTKRQIYIKDGKVVGKYV